MSEATHLPTTPRVPGLSPRRYVPPQPYTAPTAGTIDERLADMAQAINAKADRTGVPNFTAITLHGADGMDYLVYVDAVGVLRADPVTL